MSLLLPRRRRFTNVAAMGSAAPATPPSASFVSQIGGPSGGGTAVVTFTGVDIGSPTFIATRRVLVYVVGGTSGRNILATGTTINGVPVDSVEQAVDSSGSGTTIYTASAVVPSGTTGVTVVLTFDSTQFNSGNIVVYNVDNSLLVSPTPIIGSTSGSAATSASTAVAVLSGGFIVAGVNTPSAVSSITSSDAGLSPDDAGAAAFTFAHANNIAASPASNATASFASSAFNFALFAYR